MEELLDDPSNETWIDTLLEMVPVRMRVFVEAAESETAEATWSKYATGLSLAYHESRSFIQQNCIVSSETGSRHALTKIEWLWE